MVTGSSNKSSRTMMYLLCWSIPECPTKPLLHCKEDHLNDMYEHKSEHQRSRNNMRRNPHSQGLMQEDQRVDAPLSRRGFDRPQQCGPFIICSQAHGSFFELLARFGQHELQLLPAHKLPKEKDWTKKAFKYSFFYLLA